MDVDYSPSLGTDTMPDIEVVSYSSSYANTTDKTVSDIVLPPPLPEGKTMAELQKLRSLGRHQRENNSRNPFLNESIDDKNPFLVDEDETSTIYSEKDKDEEKYDAEDAQAEKERNGERSRVET